jgi:acetylornithine/succinyldiaminopimelate/putrescine aminotransferase
LGELGQNVSGNISGIAKAILVGGFCFGVYLVISGLVEFYNSNKKPNCTFGGAAIKCSVGVCLLAAQAIASSFSTTLFGGDKSATGWGTLGF